MPYPTGDPAARQKLRASGRDRIMRIAEYDAAVYGLCTLCRADNHVRHTECRTANPGAVCLCACLDERKD